MKAYYCVGTHWDREWYETFQEFRMWLVEQIDEVMDLMEREPGFECFHLDGQAVVLEDYLAIRPEQRGRLLDFLKSGRLQAGPWYVLPDEWLISGESFVRNLMKGTRVCRELGFEPADFAYTPDQFGHVAALPMIVAGFGIPAGICWRGAQNENYPAQFMWVGPDGSRMVTHKLTDEGGYGAFGQVRLGIEGADFADESFAEHFEPYFDKEKGRASAPLVLMIDAVDHQCAPEKMVRLMQELRERYPEEEFVWGTFAQYGQEMLAHADELPERRGELREPARDAHRQWQYLIVHTISSRYPLKQRNDQCQALLERWAEPCALFHAMAYGQPAPRYLDLAWEYLIKNHPHDSICGCSIDQVHRDMVYRFDQCDQIGDGIVRRALAHIGKAKAGPDTSDKIVVHNPLPFRRTGVVEIPILFRDDWPKHFVDGLTTGERINKFALVKKDGSKVPFQLGRIERGAMRKGVTDCGRRETEQGDVYHVAAELDIPPCGYTAVRVEPSDDANRTFGSMMSDSFTVCNGVLAFCVEPSGMAMLQNASTDLTFEDLFVYEDCGDAGDGWTRGQLVNDLVVRTPGSRVTTAIEEDGPLRTVFRVEREFDLPRQMDRQTSWRSEDRTSLRVVDHMTVDKDSPVVRVRTVIENTCEDHRFRVLFPTELETDRSFAETPFAVVARDVLIPPETATWHERVNPETAFSTFFGLQGQEGGLAVLAPFGLHEYEVTQTPERALALTLFRSTFQTAGTAGEPNGQLLGLLEFEYLLYPFAGQFDPVAAARLVAKAQAGIRTTTTAELPDDISFLELEKGAAIVTAVKPAADGRGGVVRLWNPTDTDVQDRLMVHCPVESAERCNLNEEPQEPISLENDGVIPVTVPAGGLTTIRFVWS